MSRRGWHILREGDVLTLSRDGVARFDVAVQTEFPVVARGRLANQIRQDIWRALQGLRGFRPVVRVEKLEDRLKVTAGGQLEDTRATTEKHVRRIGEVLENPANRQRWQRFARRKHHG